MTDWHEEGREAAWNEFQKGDLLPSLEALRATAQDMLGLDTASAEEFATGWLTRALEIAGIGLTEWRRFRG